MQYALQSNFENDKKKTRQDIKKKVPHDMIQ